MRTDRAQPGLSAYRRRHRGASRGRRLNGRARGMSEHTPPRFDTHPRSEFHEAACFAKKRLPWPRTRTADHTKKGLNNETSSKTNGMRRQDVLDRPGHGPIVALPRAIRGRSYGGCIRAVEKQKRSLEGNAPGGAGQSGGGSSRGLKTWRGAGLGPVPPAALDKLAGRAR